MFRFYNCTHHGEHGDRDSGEDEERTAQSAVVMYSHANYCCAQLSCIQSPHYDTHFLGHSYLTVRMLSPPITASSWDEKGVDSCCVSVSHLTVLTSSMLAPVEFDQGRRQRSGQLQLALVCLHQHQRGDAADRQLMRLRHISAPHVQRVQRRGWTVDTSTRAGSANSYSFTSHSRIHLITLFANFTLHPTRYPNRPCPPTCQARHT